MDEKWKWYLVSFHLKRLANGSAWTQYMIYSTSEEAAIQKVEYSRHSEGFTKWQRTEDTHVEEVSDEEYNSGIIKLQIVT